MWRYNDVTLTQPSTIHMFNSLDPNVKVEVVTHEL